MLIVRLSFKCFDSYWCINEENLYIRLHSARRRFHAIPFTSKNTLLDADIVLIEPTFGHNFPHMVQNNDDGEVVKSLRHWKRELEIAFDNNKLIIIYLAPLKSQQFYDEYETGVPEFYDNYHIIPDDISLAVSNVCGENIHLENIKYIRQYWSEHSSLFDSRYQVIIEGNFSKTLVTSHQGGRIVGASVTNGKGTLLFLPAIRYDLGRYLVSTNSLYSVYEVPSSGKWNEDALRMGERFAAHLLDLARVLNAKSEKSVTPVWVNSDVYVTRKEIEFRHKISECQCRIADIQKNIDEYQMEIEERNEFKQLLFENGKCLEHIILKVLSLLGFSATNFNNSGSEFDAVFESPEGRCIGEAEGKDNNAINIDKFSQLERNIQEDYALRGEDAEYAHGVLFGNAYRLKDVRERSNFFTEKCMKAAVRTKYALVRTPDLYNVAVYLRDNEGNVTFAQKCRQAIFDAKGCIVVFPQVP